MNEAFDRVTKLFQAEPSALKQFVMVYGNCDLKGGSLNAPTDLMEPLLFQVFLRACTELGIHPSNAVMTDLLTRLSHQKGARDGHWDA